MVNNGLNPAVASCIVFLTFLLTVSTCMHNNEKWLEKRSNTCTTVIND